MVKSIRLKWYTDPAHSWLRIKRTDAERLGIVHQISAYSYQSRQGTYLYLEEDCDAPLVTEALKQSTDTLPRYCIDKHTNGRSRVRSLPQFTFEEIKR